MEYPFTVAGVNRLARVLHGALRDRSIGLPDDPELLEELRQVRIVATGPGTVKLDNPPGTHDDQAVAVALVAAELLERPTSQPARFGGLVQARTSLEGAYLESVIGPPAGQAPLTVRRSDFWGDR